MSWKPRRILSVALQSEFLGDMIIRPSGEEAEEMGTVEEEEVNALSSNTESWRDVGMTNTPKKSAVSLTEGSKRYDL